MSVLCYGSSVWFLDGYSGVASGIEFWVCLFCFLKVLSFSGRVLKCHPGVASVLNSGVCFWAVWKF